MKASHFSSDIQEFIRLLHCRQVKYLIVGGEAVIYYGYPRLTGDVDFFYGKNDDNSRLLFEVLDEFWNGDIPGLDNYRELQSPGYVIQFGVPPNRIDLINDIKAVKFDDAWQRKKEENITIEEDEVSVYFIGLTDLIINKKKTGRPKDLEDLKYLQKI